MTARLDGRAAIVTGAATGIGRAVGSGSRPTAHASLCWTLQSRGRSSSGSARKRCAFHRVRRHARVQLGGAGSRASPRSAGNPCQQCRRRSRPRDGRRSRARVLARDTELNLTSAFLGMKHMIPLMIGEGRGAIVNLSSISGVGAEPDAPAYQAAEECDPKHHPERCTRVRRVRHSRERGDALHDQHARRRGRDT